MCYPNRVNLSKAGLKKISRILEIVRREIRNQENQNHLRSHQQPTRANTRRTPVENTIRIPATPPAPFRTFLQRRNRIPTEGIERARIQRANRIYAGFADTPRDNHRLLETRRSAYTLLQGGSSLAIREQLTLQLAINLRHPDDISIIPALEFLLALSDEQVN